MKTLVSRTYIEEAPMETQTTPDGRSASPLPQRHSPLSHYLGRLKASSRRTQQVALDRIAALLTNGKSAATDLSWHRLTEQETQTVRHELAVRYAPTTANR